MKRFTSANRVRSRLRRPLAAAAALIFTTSYAQDPAPFPAPSSKKGLQVQMVEDALALEIRHAALNCNLTALHDLREQPGSLFWEVDGHRYFFNGRRVAALDALVKPLSDSGAVVYLILLAYESGDQARDEIALHPAYDRSAKTNRLAAFNTVTPEGVRHLQAAIDFLARRYGGVGGKHGRVWGYIVGNEVNSHWWWYNLGRASPEVVTREYEAAVRLVWAAVRKASANARVYLSLEHHWAIRYPPGAPDQSLPGRELLDRFAARARENGDFDWHLAFHPYPENLAECAFWKDKSATGTFETERITFRNLELLPAYFARAELRYANKPRRIILSEQGFHSVDGEEGERAQAAAYAAAWYKVARLPEIDAFIYHRHVDHAHEGLNLGLWTRQPGTVSTPERRKQIYEIFRAADTAQWRESFEFALPLIGVKSWSEFWP